MQVAAWKRASAELSVITELIGYSAKIRNQFSELTSVDRGEYDELTNWGEYDKVLF